jgi:hypothetical protein
MGYGIVLAAHKTILKIQLKPSMRGKKDANSEDHKIAQK